MNKNKEESNNGACQTKGNVPNEPFAIVIDRSYDGEGLSLAVHDGINYVFSDGDCYDRDGDTLDGYTAEFLTQYQLEQRLAAATSPNGAAQEQASLNNLVSKDAKDAARFERMFMAACHDLGAINEELGLDPDDGGAEPIIEAIRELKEKVAALSNTPQAELPPLGNVLSEREAFEQFVSKELMSYSLKAVKPNVYEAAEMAWNARAALQSAPSVQEGWISVEDRLPEQEAEYITAFSANGKQYVQSVHWHAGMWQRADDEGYFELPHWCEVTHWMPLPAAPTVQGEQTNG